MIVLVQQLMFIGMQHDGLTIPFMHFSLIALNKKAAGCAPAASCVDLCHKSVTPVSRSNRFSTSGGSPGTAGR
jgi:hypothetical protein